MADVVLPRPVKATLVRGHDDLEVGPPGCFEFYVYADSGDRPRGMIYQCPCGCKRKGALAFRPDPIDAHPSWEWDGNRDAPTLTPSVHRVGHWHGYLTAGWWRQPDQAVPNGGAA